MVTRVRPLPTLSVLRPPLRIHVTDEKRQESVHTPDLRVFDYLNQTQIDYHTTEDGEFVTVFQLFKGVEGKSFFGGTVNGLNSWVRDKSLYTPDVFTPDPPYFVINTHWCPFSTGKISKIKKVHILFLQISVLEIPERSFP